LNPNAASRSQRLYTLLAQLRTLAAHYLRQFNPDHWEREYFLLLAAYSLYTVRFEQHRSALRAAAYVAAGTAAAAFQRLSNPATPNQEPTP